MTRLWGTIPVLIAVASPALADEGASKWWQSETYDGRIGLGVLVGPEFPGADEYRVMPAPSFAIERGGYSLRSDGPGVAADLFPGDTISLGPRIAYAGGRSDVEDGVVDRMADVDGGLDLGLEGDVTFPLSLSPTPVFATGFAEINQEVAGGHGGLTGSIGAGVSSIFERFNIGFTTAVNFASDDYMDSFFGVSSEDSTATGLPQYNPDGGLVSVSNTLRVTVPFLDVWSVTALGSYEHYLGDASDSPVVSERGNDAAFSGIFAVGYSF